MMMNTLLFLLLSFKKFTCKLHPQIITTYHQVLQFLPATLFFWLHENSYSTSCPQNYIWKFVAWSSVISGQSGVSYESPLSSHCENFTLYFMWTQRNLNQTVLESPQLPINESMRILIRFDMWAYRYRFYIPADIESILGLSSYLSTLGLSNPEEHHGAISQDALVDLQELLLERRWQHANGRPCVIKYKTSEKSSLFNSIFLPLSRLLEIALFSFKDEFKTNLSARLQNTKTLSAGKGNRT